MPKQIYNNTDFSGGINGIDSPRDVQDNQVINAKSVAFDEKGRIRMMGKAIASNPEEVGLSAAGFDSGTSFFHFSHDYNMIKAGPALEDSPDMEDDGVEIFAIANGQYVAIYDFKTELWLTTAIDMKADIGLDRRNLGFYFANAALRCYNKYFGLDVSGNVDQVTRWCGHIRRDLFGQTDDEPSINEWFTTTSRLMAPEATAYSNIIGSEKPGNFEVRTSTNVAVVADHLSIAINWNDEDTGTWIAGNYPIYLSYIYDGSQESPVAVAKDTTNSDNEYVTAVVNQSLYMGILIDWDNSGIKFNKRITGGRVYYSDPADGHGVKYHLLDIDFVKGCKKFDETTYTPWGEQTDDDTYECPTGLHATGTSDAFAQLSNVFKFEDMPKSVTYEMLNGYGADEVTSANFKCHTIFNNRTYIGNIQQITKNEDSYSSTTPTYPDRIIRSPINFNGEPQYDTFPASHKMDVAANDGDSITALEGFGDRLLVFKRKTVYVINVAQDGAEFVETKLSNLGVESPSQVTGTEFGVCWVNNKGCYLYSEGRPINLIDGLLDSYGARRITPNMKWNISESRYPCVAYIPQNKKLLVSLGFSPAYSNDAWVYDFTKKSWSFGGGVLGNYQFRRSNFAVSNNGYAHFGQQDANNDFMVLKWEDIEQTHTEFSLYFKDIDFGQPNVRKKFYKAYLNFRAKGTTHVRATYCVNGNYSDSLSFDTNESSVAANGLLVEGFVGIGELITNGDFSTESAAGYQNLTDGSELGSTGWYAREDSGDGGKAYIQYNKLQVKNDSDSDVIMYQTFSTAVDTVYRVTFGFSRAVTGSAPIPNMVYPQVMCYASKANDSHDNIKDDANDLGHIVVGTTGTYSFEFTSDSSVTTTALCFRAVKYSSGVPSAFGSWVSNAPTVYDIFSITSVSCSKDSAWSQAVLKPATSSEANNIYSVGLKLDIAPGQEVPSTFEIDNLSVVYRTKNVK